MTVDKKLEELYTMAVIFARGANQVAGENRDYYVTLGQLEAFIKQLSKPIDIEE